MAISNNARGSQPGVCTSTTRPTAPYEGQMIYQTDDDLTYVWGGSAWQQVSGGTAVGNSGLVYVYSETVGNSVGSFTPASAVFSTTYNNYLVTYTGGACSAQGDIGMILGATTSSYYHNIIYTAWSNSPTVAAAGATASASWSRAGIAESDSCHLRLDIANPFLAKKTIAWGAFVGSQAGRVGGSFTGYLDNTTSYTNFTLTPSAGLLSGGIVTVMGYRKA